MDEVAEILERAAKEIDDYAEKTPCGWCARKAKVLSRAARELREMHNLGVEFVGKLGEKEALMRIEIEAAKWAAMNKIAAGQNPGEEGGEEDYTFLPSPREVAGYIREFLRLLLPV